MSFRTRMRLLMLGVSAMAMMASFPVSAIIPSTGPITIADMNAEFGRGFNLGAYYGYGRAPSSGYITMESFRGTTNVTPGSQTFFVGPSFSYTFTVPNNNRVRITCVGAGGQGGFGGDVKIAPSPDPPRHGYDASVVGYCQGGGGRCGFDSTDAGGVSGNGSPGQGGLGGIASGGNVENTNGQRGQDGAWIGTVFPHYGGAGGNSGHGGAGAPARYYTMPGNGSGSSGTNGYSGGNRANGQGGGNSGGVGPSFGGGGGGGGGKAVWEGHIQPGTQLQVRPADFTLSRFAQYPMGGFTGGVTNPQMPGGFVTIEWS